LSFLLAAFLGLLQGLTEFLPVSSSGHLALFQNWFGLRETPLLFDVLLHLGTLFAVCMAFRKDIAEILRELGQMISDLIHRRRARTILPARRMAMLLIAGTLPLAGFIFLSGTAEAAMKMPLVVGLLLCATGLLLLLADRVPKGKKTEKNARVTDALVVGVCQGLALMPGLSRSGATISGGLFCKFDRAFAVRFSFLLSLPAVIGATVIELIKLITAGPEAAAVAEEAITLSFGACLTGILVAAVAGYFAIGLVRRLVSKGKFGVFAYYCLGMGLIAIVTGLYFS